MNCAKRVLAIFLVAGLCGCAVLPDPGGAPGRKGRVRARLVAGEEVVDPALVFALRDPGVQFQERAYQAQTGAGGIAELLLPAGTYYLTARSVKGRIFGYYGPNPLQVRAGEEQTVAIRGLEGNLPPIPEAIGDVMGGIEGTVVTEGGPLAGADVTLYLDAASRFRGPPYLEVSTDERGRFDATISPGRYFLVIRKRTGGEGRFGPLEVGDHFGYYAYNPVFVGSGERLTLRVGAVEVLRRSGWAESSALRTRLSGTVRDAGGRPLAGYRVFLHSLPEMLSKPDFVSDPSGEEGRYEVWAEREGVFYLGARKEIGRAREEGEVVGYYEGSPDHSVTVVMDGREMEGLDVVVREVEK